MSILLLFVSHLFFFFNDTATTEIYTLSLHDALPISQRRSVQDRPHTERPRERLVAARSGGRTRSRRLRKSHRRWGDRKSTRLNSSHGYISYAVFCLKKKKNNTKDKNFDNANK